MARRGIAHGSFGRCPLRGAPQHCRHRGTSPPRRSGAAMTTSLAEPRSLATSRPAVGARTAEPARMDLYVSIHKALRSFMGETLVRVGRIDVSDAADRDAA